MTCTHCGRQPASAGNTLCPECLAAGAHPPFAPAGPPMAPLSGAPVGPQPGPLSGPPVGPPVGAGGPYDAPFAAPFPPPPGLALRSPVGLGRATVTLLALVAVADLFAIWADALQLDSAGQGRTSDLADLATGLTAGAQVLTLIAAMVVYLCWLYRVRVNAEVFDQSGHSLKRGWAIGAWFCPIVNLWFPRRIVLDIWNTSAPQGRPAGHRLIDLWWALWLVSLFADQATTRFDGGTDAVWEARVMLFADLTDLVAAVLAALVVLRLTRMQDQKATGVPFTPVLG
ncbi:DUF4328 domain-containing protein [Streptomyces sp. LaPpAH-108]|uniref:DUF4328 domain-containing protein n=1 Tax=Streptomyces sp. LaPpAH-108 TaxID=1155714 RepID=UPI0003A23E4A|nr:DUF4328 domain-containing protein [Streptomyces sp. LaPpAH-108]